MLRLLVLSTLVAIAASQACDEGWVQYEHHHHCSCFYISPNEEKTTGKDADLICNAQGGWVIELHDTTMNMFVKEQLIKRYEPQYLIPGIKFDKQYWIGAKVHSPRHDDSHYGNWTWTHSGREVEFFDWMINEPNDWHTQNCMAYLVDQDFLGFGYWAWNDWSCDYVASVICQKPCAAPPTSPAPPPTTPAPAPTTT